jgi:three-Cys-motif partner protein
MTGYEHGFDGPWTEEKLDRVTRYLHAYTMALKNQPFQLMYIDAFVGTGYRASKRTGQAVRGFFPLPQMAELVKGSARRALEVDPPFDHYIFIEANLERFQELKKLVDDFPSMADRMMFRNEEANAAIGRRQRVLDPGHLAGIVGCPMGARDPVPPESLKPAALEPELLRPLTEYEAVIGGGW